MGIMKKATLILGVVALCAIACVLMMSPGCETASGLYQLTVDPSFVELTYASNSVTLAVIGTSNNLSLPLTWSVSNPELGYIAMESGYSALYFRHAANGDNVVMVRDQYDNEGFATISQKTGENALSIQKTRADTNTWTLSVINPGSGTYEWWVHKPSLGEITTIGNGQSAVYDVKDFSQRNDVYVRDRRGNIGSASIP